MENILGQGIAAGEQRTMTKQINDLTNDNPAKVSKEFLDYLAEIDSKEASKDSELNEELGVTLDEMGFTGEAKFRCKELFHTAVRQNTSRLQNEIAKLVGQYLPILEASDIVEALSERIDELEAEIYFYEQESFALASEQVSKLSEQHQISKSVVEALWNNSSSFSDLENKLQQVSKPTRAPKKSWVEEDMEALNEDAVFAQEEGHVGDPKMRQYLKALGHK